MSEPKPSPGWSDQRVEQLMGNLLRAGVLLSAAVVLLGGILYLFEYGTDPVDYSEFRGEPPYLRSFSGIFSDALSFHSLGVIQLGLLLLIATPVARVAFSVLAFAWQRDRLYTVATLIVLSILLFSLFAWRLMP